MAWEVIRELRSPHGAWQCGESATTTLSEPRRAIQSSRTNVSEAPTQDDGEGFATSAEYPHRRRHAERSCSNSSGVIAAIFASKRWRQRSR